MIAQEAMIRVTIQGDFKLQHLRLLILVKLEKKVAINLAHGFLRMFRSLNCYNWN
jgi:hypothetical protein